ncbi:MAG: hypothetical protein OXH75_28010 [Acidobacteria bacterium]|nr:hypothetical protein [Acidobacteriota bacterium]
MKIPSFDSGTERSVVMLVAGPAALLVAKIHKIAERFGAADRVSEKDTLDVLRLLQATETATLAAGLARLANDELSTTVAADAARSSHRCSVTRKLQAFEWRLMRRA